MEESEKRRERLNAMRIEAAQTGVYIDSGSSGSASNALSNPLIENETASAPPHQYTAQRFDFYTDPMSAFTGSKRRNNVSPQVSQGHYNPPPPRPMDQGMIPNPSYHYPAMNSPGQGIFNQPRAHFNPGPVGSPMGSDSPLNRPHQYPPSSWGGPVNYGPPPNFSRGGNFPSPGFRRGDSPHVDYGQGGGGYQGQNSNFQYDSGRGRGRGRSYGGNSMSSGSGSGFRRGSGSRDSVSGEQRPDLYYKKEMVEDPWMSMQPVIWKGSTRDSEKSWLPKSIAVKKSKASPEASQTSVSQQSLAEYLAASFNDSVDEAVEDEVGT
ncbi:hypothetical protein PHJA_001412700 [Phtheirospermum japonicum]|uniref:Uncharacterized protein n=1 Tax=Phtheirospermum japonicum TaxID=374723 RepID=A0A830CBW2_9LAMI|nr:hypothetical protein PHJA_001412700 [Phtheirospermum japonicum]